MPVAGPARCVLEEVAAVARQGARQRQLGFELASVEFHGEAGVDPIALLLEHDPVRPAQNAPQLVQGDVEGVLALAGRAVAVGCPTMVSARSKVWLRLSACPAWNAASNAATPRLARTDRARRSRISRSSGSGAAPASSRRLAAAPSMRAARTASPRSAAIRAMSSTRMIVDQWFFVRSSDASPMAKEANAPAVSPSATASRPRMVARCAMGAL